MQSSIESRPPTQEARRSASNERLIAAALELIAERGIHNVSLADVGLKAGFSRGLPSERFGSKLGLMQAIVNYLRDWLEFRVAESMRGRVGLDAVLTRIDCHLVAAIANPAYHRVLYHLLMDAAFSEPGLVLSALEETLKETFIRYLREGQAKGEIDPSLEPAQQSIIIIGALRGVIIQAVVSGPINILETARRDLRRMFLLLLTAHRMAP